MAKRSERRETEQGRTRGIVQRGWYGARPWRFDPSFPHKDKYRTDMGTFITICCLVAYTWICAAVGFWVGRVCGMAEQSEIDYERGGAQ